MKDYVVRGVPGRVDGLEGTVSLDLEGRPILDEVVLESSAQRDLVLVLPGKLEDLAVGLKTEKQFPNTSAYRYTKMRTLRVSKRPATPPM